MEIPIVGQPESTLIIKLVYNPSSGQNEIQLFTDQFYAGLPMAVVVLTKALDTMVSTAFEELFRQAPNDLGQIKH